MYDIIDAPVCTLGENPLWRADTGEFYWTDIVNGRIYAWNPSGLEKAYVVLITPFQIGAFLFTHSFDLLLFTEKGVYLSAWSGNCYSSSFRLLWNVPFEKEERFNDAICGPDGRILAGSKRNDNKEGCLYCFEWGKEPKLLLEHLSISNGMGFSPDGTTFYHTDSGPGCITAYRYGPGGLSDKIGAFFQTSDPNAVPDGMTVDSKGNIWTALWGGHTVLQISPQKIILKRFSFTASQVSSLCFGGKELNLLLVTSASIGAEKGAGSDMSGLFRGGCTYLLSDAGKGKAEYVTQL